MFDEYELPVATRKTRRRSQWDRSSLCGGADWKNQDFKCVHCRGYVSTHISLAGVHNRNHCPSCLWSRHMDLVQAGDRLSACKAGMRPVGLTLKISQKKYVFGQSGELMLVHRCTDCENVSINRIAADDDAECILAVFEESLHLPEMQMRHIEDIGIRVLQADDLWIVQARLFGQ